MKGINYQESNFKKVVALTHPDVRQSYEMIASVGGQEIEPGTIFGLITSGDNAGKVRPLGLTYITKTEAEAASTFEVADASILKVGDSVKITASGDAVTITAISLEDNTFSVATEDAQTATKDDAVILQDGSDTALGVLVEPVEFVASAQPVPLLIHGMVYLEAITNKLLATQLAKAKSDLFNRIWFLESY